MKRITLFSFMLLFSMLTFAQVGRKHAPALLQKQQAAVMNHAVKGMAKTTGAAKANKIRKAEGDALVTPPEGAETETWEYQSGTLAVYTQSGWANYTANAPKSFDVAISGSDIYIKGLAYYFQDAWVKGTINGDQVTIPHGQFVGEDEYGAEYLNGQDFNDQSEDPAPVDIVFAYDAAQSMLTLNESMGIMECESAASLGCYSYWENLVIKKQNPEDLLPVTPPAGLTTADMPLSGKAQISESVVGATVKVGIDGNDVYVQGLVQAMPEAWMKGQLTNKTVTFPIQVLGNVEGTTYWAAGYASNALAPFTMAYDAERNTYEAEGMLLANPEKSSLNYNGLLDYYSGLYIGERPEKAVAPEGLETKEKPFTGYDSNKNKVEGTVKIGIDGNDVWFQGLFADVPEGWFKGTFNDDKTEVTVAYGQYLGVSEASYYNVFIVGDNAETESVDNVIFSYDEKNDVYVAQNNIYENNKADDIYYFEVYTAGLMIGEPADATWIAGEQGYSNEQDITEFVIAEGVNATLAKNEGKNSPKYYNNGETLRMYADNSLTITSEKEMAKIVFTMTGSNKQMLLESDIPTYTLEDNKGTWEGQAKEVTFTVPNVSGNQARIQRIDIFYFDYSTTLVEAPADLVAEEYYFKGTDTYYNEESKKTVKVGFYGDNEVYMQGLSDYTNEAWVKGNLVDGVLTVPNWYLGEYASFFGSYELTFSGAEFAYDAEADQFTTAEFKTLTPQGMAMDEFADVTITKVIEKAAMPAQPIITSYGRADDYDYAVMNIPMEDTEGLPMASDKLFYRLYTDIQGEVSQLEFTADDYTRLTENMTEIPYNFTENYDFYATGSRIYFNQADRTSWDKIGVQSVYRGMGEENVTEIFWFDINEFLGVENVVANELDANAPIYNLQGMRVNNANQKGIYIQNGKKFVK